MKKVIPTGNPGRRPAAVKATKKAVKAGVALGTAKNLINNPSSAKDVETAFSLQEKSSKLRNQTLGILSSTQSVLSQSPKKLNKKMNKRVYQSLESRGK